MDRPWRLAALLAAVAVLAAAGCGKPRDESQAGGLPVPGGATTSDTVAQMPAADAPAVALPAAGRAEGATTAPSAPDDFLSREEALRRAREIDAEASGVQARGRAGRGNLSPELAAEITNAVAKLSLAEIPAKDLPKDPKVMLEINERIRKKSDELYAKYNTTMRDVMRYISDLSPKEREAYNQKMTELFLEESKKKYGDLKVK